MRPHRWLLRCVSRLVPRDLRADWLDEWTAEVAYRERQRDAWRSARRAPFDLVRRASGAFWDALWLRSSRWYALRLFAREWRLALSAVLSLATAIAAVVVGLAACDALLFAPPGIADASALRVIHVSSSVEPYGTVSFPEYRDYRRATGAFSDIAAFPSSLSGVPLKKDHFSFQVLTAEVSDNFFSVLGVGTERGELTVRAPRPGDLDDGLVVISDALWRRLGAESSLAGDTIEVNGRTVRVAGVAAPDFRGLSWGFSPDVWLPFLTTPPNGSPDRLADAGAHWLHLVGRLKRGVGASQAASDSAMLAAMVDREPGAKPATHRGVLSPISVTPPDERGWMTTLLGGMLLIVALTLVVACANVTNLLLGLAVSRRHEMVVRAALGASRLQIMLPLVREGAMLGLVAGLLGSTAAWAGLAKLANVGFSVALFMPPMSLDLRPHAAVWIASVALALGAGAAASAMPALRSASEGAEGLLQRAVPSTRRHARARRVLVVVQMVVCTIALAAVGLAARSLVTLRHLPLGFAARDLAFADIDVARTGFNEKTGPAFYHRVLEWTMTMPGVSAAALASADPFEGVPDYQVRVASDRPADGGTMVPAFVVDDHYFATIEMPLLAGRPFDARDRAASMPVAIVNATMAQRTWPGLNAAGRYIRMGDDRRTVEIVGVVPDSKYGDLDEPPMSVLYLPLAQHYEPQMTILARTTADPFALPEHLSKLAPTPVFGPGVGTLKELLELALALPRGIVWAAVVFGVMALVLTVFGLYSTVFYSVSLRRAELGIRTALGATPTQLFRLVLSESARVAAIGAAIGLLAAALLTPLASSIFVGIGTSDPVVLAGVAIACAVTTIVIALVVVRPWTRLPATTLLNP